MKQEDFTARVTPYYEYHTLKNQVTFTLYVTVSYKGKQVFKGRLDTFEPTDGEQGDEIMYGSVYYNSVSTLPTENGNKFIEELEQL